MNLLYLDIPTMITMLAVGNLVSAAFLAAYGGRWSEDPARGRFIISKLTQSAAWTLLRLRDAAPDSLSVYVGNALLIAGFALEATALCVSADHARRRLVDRLFLAAAAAGMAMFLSMAGKPELRVTAGSLGSLPVFASLSVFMLTLKPHGRVRAFVGLSSGAFSLVLLGRALVGLQGPGFSLMTPSLIQSLAFAPVAFALLASSIALTLLGKARSERLLRESEDKYRTLVERATEGIVLVQGGKFLFANRRMADMLGLSPEELIGKRIGDYVWPEDQPMVMEYTQRRQEGLDAPGTYDFRIPGPSGPRWVSLTATPISWEGKQAVLSLVNDVDERRRDMERIRSLLRDKETLLSEVHHRVKNSLALVMSLLELQDDGADARPAGEVLRDASNRLRTMIDVYDRLGRRGEFKALGAREYLEGLVMDIASTYPAAGGIRMDFRLADVAMDPGRLGTLGIIVNEAVTNSLKYAFSAQADEAAKDATARPLEAPRIFLRLDAQDDGQACLVVGDNGRGLPDGMAPGRLGGLGLSLIAMLAEQLKARLETSGGPGTAYTLTFYP